METCKVQLVGGSTHTVSLPRGWAREHDVRAGAFLHLHPLADGSLLLSIDGEKDGETVEDERSDRTISDSREPRSPLSNCGNPSATQTISPIRRGSPESEGFGSTILSTSWSVACG